MKGGLALNASLVNCTKLAIIKALYLDTVQTSGNYKITNPIKKTDVFRKGWQFLFSSKYTLINTNNINEARVSYKTNESNGERPLFYKKL